ARYFGVSLEPGRRGFYYSRFGTEGSRVYRHSMGSAAASDSLLFGAGYGPGKIIVSKLSEDGRRLLIAVYYGSATDRSEVYVKDVAAGGPVVPIVNDVEAYFEPDIAGDHVYMQTNWKASNNRILDVDLASRSRDHWREVVPESDAAIESFSLAGGKIFVNELKNVVSTVRVYSPAGKLERTLDFTAPGSVADLRGRWAGGEAFFSYSSFVVPTTIVRLAVASGERKTWWKPDVPIAADAIDVKQVWYASKDGTKIPMFVVAKKGLKLDGTNPTLLTG